jgi:formimidoylglutamate deiminase
VSFLLPAAVLQGDVVRRGLAVELGADGLIAAIGPAGAVPAAADVAPLPGVLLASGFQNAHSHAFQRDIRGVVEQVSRLAPEDDFWTWREAMYAAAMGLDPESIEDVARRVFGQMRAAGYTTVGEFHYVHHRPDGSWYEEPNALAEAVCRAAESVGLRIVLLLAAYARGGAGVPAAGGQLRFSDPSLGAYLGRVDALRAWAADRPLVSVGVAPHSVRAVPRDWLEAIADHAARHDLVLHIHADEQPREIAESLAEHGLRPIELISASGALTDRTTVVHGTHVDASEIDLLAEAGATVCVCPSTEGNLGDGYVPARARVAAGVPLAVGSDSNTRVDPLEELRELELIARRTAGRRNVLVAPGSGGPTAGLLAVGQVHGATALGLVPRRLEAGAPADLVAIDLEHPEIAGVADAHLPAAIVFAGSAALISGSWIAGASSVG